jgi:hypothetical protein
MTAALRPNYRSSQQIPRIEAADWLAHDDRVLIFGEIGEQLFQGNRGMPKNCGRWNYLNFENRLLFVAYPLATFRLAFYLHAPSL